MWKCNVWVRERKTPRGLLGLFMRKVHPYADLKKKKKRPECRKYETTGKMVLK